MKFTIAYITDIHIDEVEVLEKGVDARKNFLDILTDLSSKDIDEIVIGGDIGEAYSLPWFFENIQRMNIRTHITLGNHDNYISVSKHYTVEDNKGNGELYYSIDTELYRTIFLDSSTNEISEQQFEWLQNALHTDLPIMLFIHHPLFEVETEMDVQYALIARERIQQVLLKHNNKVYVFSGHYHTADETTIGNVTQFVTPAASFQVLKQKGKVEFDTKSFGYRIIEIDGGKVNTTLVSL